MPRRLATRPGELCRAVFEPESMEGICLLMIIAPACRRSTSVAALMPTHSRTTPGQSTVPSTQDVFDPFRHLTRNLFAHHETQYHRRCQRHRWYVETSTESRCRRRRIFFRERDELGSGQAIHPTAEGVISLDHSLFSYSWVAQFLC